MNENLQKLPLATTEFDTLRWAGEETVMNFVSMG